MQATGVSSGAPVPEGVARMTFDGGAVSDDEANSWEASLTESDGSAGRDDYYDEEDDEESPSPRKGQLDASPAKEETKQEEEVNEEEEEDDAGG